MKITKRFHFCASHRLRNPRLTGAENRRLFGQCHEPHGHNFILDITVEGHVDPRTGMVINFNALKKIVERHVIRGLDHKDFSRDVPEFRRRVQTAENLALIIWARLAPRMPEKVALSRIRLYETENNWAECGPGDAA